MSGGSAGWQALVLLFNFSSALLTIIVNKYALAVFPHPAALTALHYLISSAFVASLRSAQTFERATVAPRHRAAYLALICIWALCNSLSNASLEANSVGFYSLLKVLVVPIVALLDYLVYAKALPFGKAALLVTACCGVAVATVSDVQLNARGATLAVFSVLSGVGQKMLNEHLQQRGGLSTLQLMDLCFPAMTVLAVLTVPLMDKPGVLARVRSLSASEAGLVALSSAVAVSINYSTTLVLGVTNALALVLLGQLKTCAVLLAGYLLFDAAPNSRVLGGATTAMSSLCAYAWLKLRDTRQKQMTERQLLMESLMEGGASR